MKSTSAETPLSQDVLNALRYWLRGRRGLILAGVAIVATAAALGWPSLVAAGMIPLLVSLAPCLIMCGLGFCFMKSCHKGTAANQAANPGETTTSPAVAPSVSPASAATVVPIAEARAAQVASDREAGEPAAESRRA